MQTVALIILGAIGLAILIPIVRYLGSNAKDIGEAGVGCSAVLVQGICGVVMVVSIPIFLITTIVLATGNGNETVNKVFWGSLAGGVGGFLVFGLAMSAEEKVGK
jgi:hypothetical protein